MLKYDPLNGGSYFHLFSTGVKRDEVLKRFLGLALKFIPVFLAL